MATYLFTWNPTKWDWENLDQQIQELDQNLDTFQDWGTGSRKYNIGKGDKFILVRLGISPKGIIAIGTIDSEIFEKKHWDPKLAIKGNSIPYVKLKFSYLSSTPFIQEDELNEKFPQYNWTPQTSGTTIDENTANEIFMNISNENIQSFDVETSQLENIINESLDLSETEKEQLILSRIGQGNYRKLLMKYWGKCCVTDLELPNLLIASHIKPWKVSNNFERLDVYNGFLLTPTLDRLFDQGYISFKDSGKIIISKQIEKHIHNLNITTEMRINLQDEHLKYLKFHREHIFMDKDLFK